MNVFYEEGGAFKAATILADNGTSFQVETPHGKRTKLKAAAVLLKFSEPSASALLSAAEGVAATLDADFLWECCAQEEFSFGVLGQEYFGHSPQPAEAAGLMMKLHASPMHFYKKGKGRYKPAPPEALQAALAGAEKKRREAEQIAAYTAELTTFHLPADFVPLLKPLLYQPDKKSLAYKALENACAATQLPPHRLLERCGGIPSSHAYHFDRFLFEHFPKGTAATAAIETFSPPPLPTGDVMAFSIDDATTTEIDDAFSVTSLANGNVRIGIHIAVPGLGIAPGSPLDEIARERLSTVYLPGDKLTMLPASIVSQFTLQRGRRCPALSFYVETTPDEGDIVASETRLEEIMVGENLRIESLQQLFNDETLRQGLADFPLRQELLVLWRFIDKLEERRGRPDVGKTFPPEFSFHINNDRVSITRRQRGTPVDKLVSELMIFVNSQWAETLQQNGLSAIFRAQNGGKVRMTTAPGPHQGLGVSLYMWASSPLRRYIDLMNQRQLVAWSRGETPPYEENSEAMLGAIHDFDLVYGTYQTFQRQMERYWSLRYLIQEQITITSAVVHRENLVRLQHVPLMVRVPGLPELPPGSVIDVQIDDVELLGLDFHSKFKRVVTDTPDE